MRTRLHVMLDGALALPGIVDLRKKRFDAAFARGGLRRLMSGRVRHAMRKAPHPSPTCCRRATTTTRWPACTAIASNASSPPTIRWSCGWRRRSRAGAKPRCSTWAAMSASATTPIVATSTSPQAWPGRARRSRGMAAGRALAQERDAWHELDFVTTRPPRGLRHYFTSGCISISRTAGRTARRLQARPNGCSSTCCRCTTTRATGRCRARASALVPVPASRSAPTSSGAREARLQDAGHLENAEKRARSPFDRSTASTCTTAPRCGWNEATAVDDGRRSASAHPAPRHDPVRLPTK